MTDNAQSLQELEKNIDHISINDILWIQVKPYLISFGFNWMPKDTHFTISFNDSKPDINFHVTKNAENPADKPQIKIVCIDKTLLEQLAPSFSSVLLNKILQPLNLDELKKNYEDSGFISFDRLKQSDIFSLINQKLIDGFKDISKFRRKTRLKIEGDIEKALENIVTSEDLETSLFNNMVELSSEFQMPFEGGMIITEDNVLQVIRINEKWFTVRTDLKTFELLTILVNPNLAKHLIRKTMRAIIAVKQAKRYSDTEHLNKPIRLVKISPISADSAKRNPCSCISK